MMVKRKCTIMRVGVVGTGYIAHKHAQAYDEIGYDIVGCTNNNIEAGEKFAERYKTNFFPSFADLCDRCDVDFIDLCTAPNFRKEAVEHCARIRKHILVEKPIAIEVSDARKMVEIARESGIILGVVSQHRFDSGNLLLSELLGANRLGRILECDSYVKWYRSPAYFQRKGKGVPSIEGGGAVITQGIHAIDMLLTVAGPVEAVAADWQIGAVHQIETEDVANVLLRYKSGATGVLQISTAFFPGFDMQIVVHGVKGTAIVRENTLDIYAESSTRFGKVQQKERLYVEDQRTESRARTSMSRQLLDFGEAISYGRQPRVSGEDGYQALRLVEAIYHACRTGRKVFV
jgi:UDP-N-acetyl-2-amino-2-deoxyglucuronate dehydrogenase